MDLRKTTDSYRTDVIKLVPEDKALHDEINAEFNTNDVKVGDAILDWEHATLSIVTIDRCLGLPYRLSGESGNTEADIIADLKASIGTK